MARVDRENRFAIRHWLKLVLVAFWMASWAPWGFLLLGFGWTGVLAWFVLGAWFAGNLFVAYIPNQSRKHSEENAFEDKLSSERMTDAENQYIEESLQWRDNEAQKDKQKSRPKK